MSKRVFMHADETTTKVMESIQRELSTVIENKIVDIGKGVLTLQESLETINDDITSNSDDLNHLNKANSKLIKSVGAVNDHLQVFQNGQEGITSIVETVRENITKLQVSLDASSKESINAIELILKQQESILEEEINRNIKEIASLSNNIKVVNGKNNEEMKFQGNEIKTITSKIALNLAQNDKLLEMLDLMKQDGNTMIDSIKLTQNQLSDIAINVAELKNEVAYLSEPFYKRWFSKKKRGTI